MKNASFLKTQQNLKGLVHVVSILMLAVLLLVFQIFPVMAAEYTATLTETNDENVSYGYRTAVSSDGNTVVVSDSAADGQIGAVYVYRNSNTGWLLEKKLTSIDCYPLDHFGSSVAISGDGNTIVVGASDYNHGSYMYSGAAFVFTRTTDGTWDAGERIICPEASNTRYAFGISAAVNDDGSIILIGANGATVSDLDDAGAVYVYEKSAGWNYQTTLTANTPIFYGGFGCSVSLDGNRAVIGAPGQYDGSAYVFTYNEGFGTWTQDARISDRQFASNLDSFGSSVAIDDDTIIVGATNGNPASNTPAFYYIGVAYVYHFDGSNWALQQRLNAPDYANNARFGTSVAIKGDVAYIGSPNNDRRIPGKVYTFNRINAIWSPGETISSVDQAAYDNFGCSIRLAKGADEMIVGAVGNIAVSLYGAVYVYGTGIPPATYSVEATVNGGNGTADASSGVVDPGNSSTVTFNPDTGYHIYSVIDNSSDVTSLLSGNKYTLNNISDDHTIVVTYAIDNYNVTVGADPTEGGSVNGGGDYTYNQTVQLTATANPGYQFVNWTESGTEVSTAAAYSFAATASTTLTAHFAADKPDESLLEQVQTIEEFYAESLADGTLTGTGKTERISNNQLNAFNNMLLEAERLIAEGSIEEAIVQLESIYAKVDGLPNPPDFVQGQSREQLAQMILDLLENLRVL